jgi:hypothetical protein
MIGGIMLSKLFGKRTPDFSAVDSNEKVQTLFIEGKLEKLHLFPLDYGGKDIPLNVVFVPPGIGQIKSQIDASVGKLVAEGLVSNYEAKPEYKGSSFIPSKIKVTTSHPEKSGEFNYSIDVW